MAQPLMDLQDHKGANINVSILLVVHSILITKFKASY